MVRRHRGYIILTSATALETHLMKMHWEACALLGGTCNKKKEKKKEKTAEELIKSHCAQMACTCSWLGNIQSNCSLREYITHVLYSSASLEHRGTVTAAGTSLQRGRGQLREIAERGMTWISERKSEELVVAECAAEWGEDWETGREMGVRRERYSALCRGYVQLN